MVQIAVRAGELSVADGARVAAVTGREGGTDGSWLPLRRVAVASNTSWSVAVDDLDPFRDLHHIPAAPRLDDEHYTRWARLFREAWDLLERHAPDYAEPIRVGLRALVPLAAPGRGPARSATVRDAFGAFGLTEPNSAVDLAVTLVHEFQHSKLSALLDLVPLYDVADRQTYFAPWHVGGQALGTRRGPGRYRVAPHSPALASPRPTAGLTGR